MKKHLLVWALCAGLFFVGCSDDGNDPDPGPNPPEPPALSIDEIIKLPYSSLKPDEQKVKLENEGIAFIDMANALKTSTSVEAYQTLGELLEMAQPTLLGNKKAATIEETVQYAEVYGIHTWDATKKEWVKTASTSELKFVYPSKKNGTTNNAEFSVNAVSSGIPVTFTDKYWDYDNESDENIAKETTYYLPSSAKGSLKVGGAEVGTINLTAEYKDKKEVPVKMEFLTKLSDGYELGASFNKAAENKVVSYLKHNNDVMFYAEVSATAKLDEIFENAKDDTDPAFAAYGKVNGHFKLLNNLVIVITGDATKYAEEMDAVSAKYEQKRDAYDAKINALGGYYRKYKDCYVDRNLIKKEESEERVIIINKYIKPILAATNEDAAKIAQLELKLELAPSNNDNRYWDDLYWDDTDKEWKNCWQDVWNEETQRGEWVKVAEPDPNGKYENYNKVSYLRFNDNTLVEADTYFSAGFSKFTEKWNAFVKAFEDRN